MEVSTQFGGEESFKKCKRSRKEKPETLISEVSKVPGIKLEMPEAALNSSVAFYEK